MEKSSLSLTLKNSENKVLQRVKISKWLQQRKINLKKFKKNKLCRTKKNCKLFKRKKVIKLILWDRKFKI